MNTTELKEITKRIYKGNASKTDEMDYNYYVACWGI